MMCVVVTLSAIIIITTQPHVAFISKYVSHDSSQRLLQADWTCCQVEYYNEPKKNNTLRSIKSGIFVHALNPTTALPLSVGLVWSGQWSLDSSVSFRDEQISLTTVPGHLIMLLLHRPGASSFFCVREHASSWKGSITISDSRGRARPASRRKGHFYMKR